MAGNPYGITQVDIPSMLGMHQQMKHQRLEQLFRAKQVERQDREDEREDKKHEAMSKLFMKGGGQTSPAAATPAPPVASGPAAGEASAPPQMPAIGQPMPPRTDGLTLNQEAFQQLLALDPQSAMQVQKLVYDSNEAGFKQIQRSGEVMAQAATLLAEVSPEQRAARLQQLAPELAALGIPSEQLARADLSDAGLEKYLVLGQSMKELLTQRNKDRDFEADEAYRRSQLAQGDRRVRVSEGALGLARQREGRVARGGGSISDLSGMSDQALLDALSGN